jgi:hypothetical protein
MVGLGGKEGEAAIQWNKVPGEPVRPGDGEAAVAVRRFMPDESPVAVGWMCGGRGAERRPDKAAGRVQ